MKNLGVSGLNFTREQTSLTQLLQEYAVPTPNEQSTREISNMNFLEFLYHTGKNKLKAGALPTLHLFVTVGEV